MNYMEDKDLVSVIIPTFNRPLYLSETIESVMCQTYPNIEIIVVDDGSKNKGQETLKTLKPYLSKLIYIYQENQGIGAAVNKGISIAKGEFIQRLDDDDILEKEKIERCVEIFQKKSNVGLVATGYYVIDESGNRTRTMMPLSYPRNARLLFMLMFCISAQVAVMVRKSCHSAVGLYRTDIMAEDYEMWLRITRKFGIETINEPLASYRRHGDNITRLRNLQRLEENTLQFVKSYLDEIPLGELIPNIRSDAYGYALKAVVYLLKDGMHIRTVDLARKELEKASKLAPYDPLIHLWELVLAIHGNELDLPLPENLPKFGEFQESAKSLIKLMKEFRILKASSLSPSSPEMTDFRGRFGVLRGELMRESYKRAIAG